MRAIRALEALGGGWGESRRRSRPKALFGNLIASMRDRLAREPDDVELRLALATHLGRAGRYDEALAEADKLAPSSPLGSGVRRLRVELKLKRLLRGDRPLR